MKKITSVLLLGALVLSAFLCGCEKPVPQSTDITSSMIAEANTLEKYLAAHENVFCENTTAEGAVFEAYADRAGNGFADYGYNTFFIKDGNILVYSNGEYSGVIDEDMFGLLDLVISASPEYTELETVVSAEEKDGTLYVTSVAVGDSVDILLSDMGKTAERTDGDRIVINYELEPETLEIKKCEAKYLSESAGEVFLYRVRLVPDRPLPIKMAQFEKTYEESEKRTVTAVFDPGKAEEKTLSCVLPKGLQALLKYDNERCGLFTDPEGKTPLSAPTDRDKDVTVYVIAK